MNFKKIAFILTLCFTIFIPGCAKQNNVDDKKTINSVLDEEYSTASSVTLTDEEAASLNNSLKVKLYFKTIKGDKLSYETKLIQFSDKDKKDDVLASKIIDALIKGPSNASLQKTLPDKTVLNNIKITDNTIFVDFNEDFSKGLSNEADTKFIAYSIANTLTEFKNIDEVVITCCQNKIISSTCDFSSLSRNTNIVTDIESAIPENDYSEDVFLEIELE